MLLDQSSIGMVITPKPRTGHDPEPRYQPMLPTSIFTISSHVPSRFPSACSTWCSPPIFCSYFLLLPPQPQTFTYTNITNKNCFLYCPQQLTYRCRWFCWFVNVTWLVFQTNLIYVFLWSKRPQFHLPLTKNLVVKYILIFNIFEIRHHMSFQLCNNGDNINLVQYACIYDEAYFFLRVKHNIHAQKPNLKFLTNLPLRFNCLPIWVHVPTGAKIKHDSKL